MRKDRSNKWGQGALCVALVTCAMLISTSAFATGFEYKLVNKKSQTDGEPPTLVLQATDIVNSAKIEIKSSSAKNKTVKVGRMNPGATKAIPLRVGKGAHTFTVKISAEGAEVLWESKVMRNHMAGCTLGRTNMSNCVLKAADLKGASIAFANLSYADLERADLSGTDLSQTDLSWANLSGANLKCAHLEGSNLFKVLINGADLKEADLRGVQFLQCPQLVTARNWQSAYRDQDLACGAGIPNR